MNPDLPLDQREELELKLSALLLGELNDTEAAALLAVIRNDAELSALYERLKQTVVLVREASATPAAPIAAEPVRLRLSEARRQQLLAQFKTVQPKEFARPARQVRLRVVAIAAVVAVIAILSAMLLPVEHHFLMSSISEDSGDISRRSWGAHPESAPEPAATATPEPYSANVVGYVSAGQPGQPPATPQAAPKAQPLYLGQSAGFPSDERVPELSVPAGSTAGRDLFLLAEQSTPAPDDSLTRWGSRSTTYNEAPGSVMGGFFVEAQSTTGGGGGGIGGGKPATPSDASEFKFLGDKLEPRDQAAGAGSLSVANVGRAVDATSGIRFEAPPAEGENNIIATRQLEQSRRAGSVVQKKATGDSVARPEVEQLRVPQVIVAGNTAESGEEKQEADLARLKAYAGSGIIYNSSNPEAALRGMQNRVEAGRLSIDRLKNELAKAEELDADASAKTRTAKEPDTAPVKPAAPPPVPQPEILTRDNPFSTFSLNVSDVSFRLTAASLANGQMPDPASIRTEEFINAFDYRDPEPAGAAPIALAWERARDPFSHNRDLLRFSIKTAAQGRQAGRPLNLVLLLDNSGSMERADRVAIIRNALTVLASQLQSQDKISVVLFARTARLWLDGASGGLTAEVIERLADLTPQGGTNLEDALELAYETARRHYLAGGINRVVVLTDGAANLGEVNPELLKQQVETNRQQGIALDCFGVGWEGYNDDLLELLSRNGDGRYGFINTPKEAATEFAGQLAGALRVAASDVKVQVEFNPQRVTAYRQIGYAKHQLTKEQFRDNTVDAAEIGAAESGNALYAVEINPSGTGPLGTVRVRFKVPGTAEYREMEWAVPYTGTAAAIEQAGPAMRLATCASAFAEWLASSPFAGDVTADRLLGYLAGVPEVYGADARPGQLEWMIRQTGRLTGK